jgi:hypothetical protein
MTPGFLKAKRSGCRLAVGLALLALPGCGGVDGVELNGKVFDAVGLTGALGKKEEPRTEPRAPLVLPPTADRLPEPGEGGAPAPVQTAEAWPNDPDKRRAQGEAAKKQAQAEYCRDGNWKEKALVDDLALSKEGASCGSIFTALGKTLFGE